LVAATLAHPAFFTPVAVHAWASAEDPNAETLKQRDRLWRETQTLRSQGKTAEAITAAEAMLAIERKVLSADDPRLAESLGWLAGLLADRRDFAGARPLYEQALAIRAISTSPPPG
jgi:hypothetical protein